MGIYGQDWASYQSDTPPTAGLAFFFTKITQGLGYVNPKWRAQYAHGTSAGLVPGKYHYPDMRNTVPAEADHFLAQADVRPADLVALDWEGYDKANATVPKAKQLAYKDAWLRYVKGRLPHNAVGMYANTDYWTNVDHGGYYGDFLWIATAGRPVGDPGITAPWLFHQYSANGVDRDYCRLSSAAALRAWAEAFAPKTPPAPTTPVVTVPPVPAKENKMIMIKVDQATVPATAAWPGIYLLTQELLLRHVATPEDENAFRAAGVTGPFTISYAQYLTLGGVPAPHGQVLDGAAGPAVGG